MSDSLLPLLNQKSRLPVEEVQDKAVIQNSRVYLAPADYHLLVDTDHFALSVDPPVRYSRPSIDVLFETAAYAFQSEVLGVILTGANRDGAQGAQHIKKRGGRILVQDPATAYSAVMPRATLNAVQADWVLPLGEIAPFLVRLAGENKSS